MTDTSDTQHAQRVHAARDMATALQTAPRNLVIVNARAVDAHGVTEHSWIASSGGVIEATGTSDADLNFFLASRAGANPYARLDAGGRLVTPGFVDLHAHGSWAAAYDDGEEAIEVARAGHARHGTTRQVLSLITNPLNRMETALQIVHSLMPSRPDILGSHLEGPFLAVSRKGAHDPNYLIDPTPKAVDRLLTAAGGSLRQITLAPERAGGLEAVRTLVGNGVIAAVGHTDADYETARAAFDAGSTLITHIFNAMNGLHHRAPGPIAAAFENPDVTVELINDGFHVQDPVNAMVFHMFPHRVAGVTDAMAATDCPDGSYTLGGLDVTVDGGHARLVSNGALAGSTLTLDVSLQRMVKQLGLPLTDAVEAVTLTPARVLGFDRPNTVTGVPLGLLASGYAADFVLLDAPDLSVQSVWCAGRHLK